METMLSSFTKVEVDFSQSHMMFPKIIMLFMLFLLILILLLYGRKFFGEIIYNRRPHRFFLENWDKIRLLGTLALITAYFYLMDIVGAFFPNTGLGFLLVSIPFMLSLSFLYVHDLNRKRCVIIVLNALIAPCTAWYILGNMFNISLP